MMFRWSPFFFFPFFRRNNFSSLTLGNFSFSSLAQLFDDGLHMFSTSDIVHHLLESGATYFCC